MKGLTRNMPRPMPHCRIKDPVTAELLQETIDTLYRNANAVSCGNGSYEKGYKTALFRITKDLGLDPKAMRSESPGTWAGDHGRYDG